MGVPTHRNLKKMTARFPGPCRRSPCSTRIAVGDAIYFSSETGAYCQACGAEVAKARSSFGAAKSSDRARRIRERREGERVVSHVRRHGTLPAWWVATRPDAREASMWLPSLLKRAAETGERDTEPCDCRECTVGSGRAA